MKSIRITKTPPGFAPEEIRDQWVGLVIPLVSEDDLAQNPPSGMRIGNENTDGYIVSSERAIEALYEAGRSSAADFWVNTPLGMYLEFKKDACDIID